jgi:hypothetical protein
MTFCALPAIQPAVEHLTAGCVLPLYGDSLAGSSALVAESENPLEIMVAYAIESWMLPGVRGAGHRLWRIKRLGVVGDNAEPDGGPWWRVKRLGCENRVAHDLVHTIVRTMNG